ncbi:MAG: 4Fe-4S dicluster domain-containing protein [Planctomycetaceae bacterium]|jgi:formate dehydrogenase iron-sulfur subunit|nr:4Fe-4S dicluster domain-containing protein [Planctomycetaceae bacterium]
MSKAVLVNLTKCIGCGGCTVACKMYNDNQWVDGKFPSCGENAQLADENWTVIKKFKLHKDDGSAVWRFVKHQCFHCQSPACVSACFARALQKTDEGAVVYYSANCVGCRYCMLACPFQIPKYEWAKPIPVITKCVMCFARIKEGKSPACVSVCPEQVMKFGERDELLNEAKKIIHNSPHLIDHIYGEHEVGGTSWIYISDVPFEKIGFRTNVTKKTIPSYTETYTHCTPIFGVIWATVLTLLYFFTKRRNNLKAQNTNNTTEPNHDKNRPEKSDKEKQTPKK